MMTDVAIVYHCDDECGHAVFDVDMYENTADSNK